jgi:hypothetical protein
MIRPACFSGNAETAASNRFQDLEPGSTSASPQLAAAAEFDGLVHVLRTKGVRVYVFADRVEPVTPDALFPNNWVSFHADGTAVLYPMLAPNRRLERRLDILEVLSDEHRLRLDRVIDLTHGEQQGRFLEGTGSLVLDRRHRVAYACLSPRTDPGMLSEFGRRLDYETVPFVAVDVNGYPIYHTNVMLSVGERFAAVCTEALVDADRRRVLDRLESTGHAVIELTRKQMRCFAGNMLELGGVGDERLVAVSAAGYASLDASQKQIFAGLGISFAVAPLPTIERLGGGSARCMIAEIQLPRREA